MDIPRPGVVRRASQDLPTPPAGSGGAAPSTPPTTHDTQQLLPQGAEHAQAQRGPERGLSERRLLAAVLILAALVVVSGIALAVSVIRGSGRPSPTAAPATQPRRAGVSTTTAAPPASGALPHISSLSPASGSAGQTITVTGSGFLSSNGLIVAAFNGRVTTTSCPSQDMCTVTVPPPPAGATSAQVTITTASGTSNAVGFSYG